MNILVLNPGSTSTKVAVYQDETEVCRASIPHSADELSKFKSIYDQLDFRFGLVMDFLKDNGYSEESFDCIVSRGGTPPGARSGATIIGRELIKAIYERPKQYHASNIGMMIADKIACINKIQAFIYDPISTDELNPLAAMFGVKGIKRDSMCHVLNTRAMAIAAAKDLNRKYDEMNIVVVHIGGGCSVSLWSKGKLTDTVPADSGHFATERCGAVRCEQLLDLIDQYGMKQIREWMVGKGGMVSLLGTNDLREVEARIVSGDGEAKLCTEAMAYQIAKSIGSLWPVVNGNIDALVFTGGGAYWKRLIDLISERIAYLKVPIMLKPGENEMKALAEGALRVMRGEETAQEFDG